jgi:hypothetical protein
MRRLTIVLIVLLTTTFALSRLYLLYSHKFYDVTGTAEWISDKHRLAAGDPLAFFAVRDFELPSNRYYTKIKIVGDPEYTLYFNGVEIGGRRVGEDRWLDVYDVTPFAKTGRNRIVVAMRSDNGVGGLIAALDIAPDYQNMVVSGRDWKIYRQWSDRLLLADVPSIASRPPMLLGRPPMRRWNYLERRERSLATPPQKIVPPKNVSTMIGALPEVRVINGVAVTVTSRSDGLRLRTDTRTRAADAARSRESFRPRQRALRERCFRARAARREPAVVRLRQRRADDHRSGGTIVPLRDGVRLAGARGRRAVALEQHFAHEVLFARHHLVIDGRRIFARHPETSRRAAGHGSHEELDHLDLRALHAGVAHHQKRRRGDGVEHFLFGVGRHVRMNRVRRGRRDLVLEDPDVLEGAHEFVDHFVAHRRTACDDRSVHGRRRIGG